MALDSFVLDRYLPFLQQELTPRRLQHCLGVMQVMKDLIDVYALDAECALTTGLLHDAAKDLSQARWEQIVRDANIQLEFPCEEDYVHYLHGPVSAIFVRDTLGLQDPAIFGAIWTHTFTGGGEYFHAPLSWCLRFSDILEPSRNWSSSPAMSGGAGPLREAVYAGKMAEAIHIHTSMIIHFFDEMGKAVHPHMYRVMQGG